MVLNMPSDIGFALYHVRDAIGKGCVELACWDAVASVGSTTGASSGGSSEVNIGEGDIRPKREVVP